MNRRFTLCVLLLSLAFSLVAVIQPVWAQDTIYIRADGSIEGTDKIVRDGDVYTFLDDINGSLVVEKDNVVMDGAGFILQGTGSMDWIGVDLSSRKNVTVKNMVIKRCGIDIRIFGSSNCLISDNIIDDYHPNGVYLEESSNNVISGNNGEIKLLESDGNILLGNSWNIVLSKSSNNTISGNRNSIKLYESSNNSISENNSSISLYTQSKGNIIYENRGFIGLWESSNNSILGNNGAILIMDSNHNTVIQNTVEDNRPYGIQLGYSSGNIFSENIIQNNRAGIWIAPDVFNNSFYRNDFVNNTVEFWDNGDSVTFWDSGSEGNYWDDYTGLDENGDGIGDTPYIIGEVNQDNYPFMEPVIIPEFPSWAILPVIMIVTFLVAMIYRRRNLALET